MPSRRCLDCRKRTDNGSRCADCERTKRRKKRRAGYARGQRAGSTREWRRTRQTVLAATGGYCAQGCGRLAVEVHHIIPRSKGGPDTPENALPLCRDCHAQITAAENRARNARRRRPHKPIL